MRVAARVEKCYVTRQSPLLLQLYSKLQYPGGRKFFFRRSVSHYFFKKNKKKSGVRGVAPPSSLTPDATVLPVKLRDSRFDPWQRPPCEIERLHR